MTHPLGQRTYRRAGTPGASGRPYACRDTGHAGTRFAVLGHVAGWGRCGRAGDASACRHTHTWPRHAGWPGAACGESAHPRGVPGTPFRGLGHLVGRDGFRRVGTGLGVPGTETGDSERRRVAQDAPGVVWHGWRRAGTHYADPAHQVSQHGFLRPNPPPGVLRGKSGGSGRPVGRAGIRRAVMTSVRWHGPSAS